MYTYIAYMYDVTTVCDNWQFSSFAVKPDPPYLVVSGCNHQQYCVLSVQSDDNLTCMVYGIRPEVQLEWQVLNKGSSVSIDQPQTRTVQRKDTFDVFLTSTVSSTTDTEQRVTIECRVVGEYADLMDLSVKLDLLITYGIPSLISY